MTIDELNKKLNDSDWTIHAKLIDGNTFFYGIDDDEILKLDRNNTVSLFRAKLANFGFFKLVTPYVDTPVNERKPEKKYIVSIAFKDEMAICYTNKLEGYDLINANKYVLPTECLFTKDDLEDLYGHLMEEYGKHYELVAETATIDANLYKELL
ncbi:hypothetical protein [Apilactobacillus timberlakei]|uniref:DUF1828 domain-containing protein n=1 Tax=Apilactobacillus timberlakei TaxID=2008380 RepID=A0ABY2YVK8_9LACO|nr:hypothetical protein [Apilactobacillus timberlakei]TPR12765.1 hypothetical protein DY048_07075 [Apilactobacillus timberlakei]TPR13648.1 hypothetical protein DY052_07945 [Apilactobacillus timberlakei]